MGIMKKLAALLFTVMMVAAPAKAEPVVVELFASHNCPACPRAFRTLKAAAKDEDVLVLTWSVDYWDYLDEADPMAMPESAERQNAYVDRFDLRGPYTPQTVYDGTLECPGNKRRKVERWIDSRLDAAASNITITAVGDSVTIDGEMGLPKDVMLIHYLDDYDGDMPNPVVKAERLGVWSGDAATFPVACDTACAVLVQASGVGEIYAAKVMP